MRVNVCDYCKREIITHSDAKYMFRRGDPVNPMFFGFHQVEDHFMRMRDKCGEEMFSILEDMKGERI